MIDYKSNTKVIGFDLDQTLYPKSPEIDHAIQSYIYEKIAAHRNCDLETAKKLFTDLYQEGKGLSGRNSLVSLGVPNAGEIVQEALEKADIAKFLKPDEEVLKLLQDLSAFYTIDLITGSGRNITQNKLGKLAISETIFHHIITADDASKSDGSAFSQWLSYYDFSPEEFLYIGDRPSSDYDAPKKFGIPAILVNSSKINTEIFCPQLSSLIEIRTLLL